MTPGTLGSDCARLGIKVADSTSSNNNGSNQGNLCTELNQSCTFLFPYICTFYADLYKDIGRQNVSM